jgi:hypothetical protein
MIKSRFLLIVLWAFSIGIFVTVVFNVPLTAQIKRTPLAGNAIIPNEDYSAWLKVQMDPSIADKDKVTYTVNTFFNVKYKSWVKLELLDFGFLFDMSDEAAREDYAYERGFYHVMLTAWRDDPITALKSYKYEPKFYQLTVTNSEARAKINPICTLIHRNPRVPDGYTPWAVHDFILVHKNYLWLIKRVTSDDPVHNQFPRGSDFNRIAKELRKRTQEEEAKQKAAMAQLMKDPRLKQDLIIRRKGLIKGISTLGWHNYVYGNASWYAQHYTSSLPGFGTYNQKFISYTNDCANFVSQCVWYGCGGIDEIDPIENHVLPMIDDDVAGLTWWADSTGTGIWITRYFWIKVADFIYMITRNYDRNAVGPQGIRTSILYMRCGDIVMAQYISHLMIITAWLDLDSDNTIDYNEIYISSHTTNRLNVQLSTLFPSISYVSFYYIYGFKTPS